MKLSILAIALLALGASAQAPPADDNADDNAADQADGVGAPAAGGINGPVIIDSGPIVIDNGPIIGRGGRGIFEGPGDILGRGGRGIFIGGRGRGLRK